MRAALVRELTSLRAAGDWSHITKQIGMFSYTGLTPAQYDVMINKWHCYMLRNGRISMAGINTGNVNYLARAIMDAAAS
jgi:aspartate/tyrosine/aromatic aminotransferase